MENQSTYRIRTKLGETEPINIPISLMQEYNSFEILSLKIKTDDSYRSYTSNEGMVIGRVSTANNGLGIPNVRVSIFVPKDAYSQTDEEKVIYPFSSPTDLDGDRVRYNLLPSESDVQCYQVVGTLPTKRKILDNETICEVFDKYYKYTTVTNEAGDFMLVNIPTGQQRIHIDADLSDIGPFLSQKPYNMIENLGFDKNQFESTRQFKTSKDLNSLVQIISQDKSLYVYPYWGDVTENSSEMKITRTDLSLNYEFKTQAIFIGSVITDKSSNSLRENCTATETAGKMSDMVTGPGRIEMIRKTIDNKIEQYKIKGDELINDNGVWCYAIPMNLDYVRTDEYGNIIPTDDPNRGVPTRARVRFRVTLNEMDSDEGAHKRCSYLVPNNPKYDDEMFLKTNDADYSFGSDTWDESFADLFWNKVYTVKNYVPRFQKTVRPTNRKHTGIKMVNHYGDNNPFPYNGMTIKLTFLYRLICCIVSILIWLIWFLNSMISLLGALPCWLANLKILWVRPFGFVRSFIPSCMELGSDFCDDGINKNVTFPGCWGCVWTDMTRPDCESDQYAASQRSEEPAVCTNDDTELFNCVENQMAQLNEATSFNFSNDWINGCLYMPLWYRHIVPKKSYFFGLFRRRAKDQWCKSEQNEDGRALKLASFCSPVNKREIKSKNYNGKDISFNVTSFQNNCGNECHEVINWVQLKSGVIVNKETMLGQKAWYYKSIEATAVENGQANEYLNFDGHAMISKIIYATDIVLLGSLDDCDTNGIPKFFNYLKGSTYNMPTDILFTDTEFTFELDEKGKLKSQSYNKISVSAGCDWGNPNEYGYDDGGLFYSIGCFDVDVDVESCVNLRRICELGVGLDDMKYIDNIDTKNATGIGAVAISSENDDIDRNNLDFYMRPDGYISFDDIIDFNYRSMFATMNGNDLKTKINPQSGVREYDFRHLYIDNFDGAIEESMRNELAGRTRSNYYHNHNLEKPCTDYLLFRMGDRPYYYDGKSLVEVPNTEEQNRGPENFTLPKYKNSFYFYFGLKEGKTAIDLFNDQYNGPCATKQDEEESIPHEAEPNGWCSADSDNNGTYDHSTYDGFLKLDLGNLPLPCTGYFNSRTNMSITYTIKKKDDIDEKTGEVKNRDFNITHETICFYGKMDDRIEKQCHGYTKYYLNYENPSIGKEAPDCNMLNNDEYNLHIIDGNGNIHSYIIKLTGEYLSFEDVEEPFKQSNNILGKYYKKSPINEFNVVAITPKNNTITVEADDAGAPKVKRTDKELTNVLIKDMNEMKLNGTICIYNIMYDNSLLKDFIIEIEPYDKAIDAETGAEYYLDKDFWNKGDKYNTWYNKKAYFDKNSNTLNDATISGNLNGREYLTIKNESQYFFYTSYEVNGMTIPCYIIKCPKGDVEYRVRVTQVCQDGTRLFKSLNYIERKIFVSQPTPYKLLINDVDYDIIHNFKSGYTLATGGDVQTKEHFGINPFKNFDFNSIKGWDKISEINENYDWSEDAERYGETSTKYNKVKEGSIEETKYGEEYVGEYALKAAFEVKASKEPVEPQRYMYDDESQYNREMAIWAQDHEAWENGSLDGNGGRMAGYTDWTTINKDTVLGGPCGYKYVKEAAQFLNNRLDFVKAMKTAFWIQCENSDKVINYSVRTDDHPYDVWTMYNPEIVSPSNDTYNETESEPGKESSRDTWKYIGESTRYITGIKIPTITSYNSKLFGIAEDSVRINRYKTSYDREGGKCFAQDNIAANSKDGDSGSISIKPPYLVACVNSEGITKPTGLNKGEFFGKKTNSYGVEQFAFGNSDNNQQKISNGSKEFFAFHLIDKTFAPDIVCWAYMNNIPYYIPWLPYDEKTAPYAEKMGKFIKTSGILSGNINNGITNSHTYVDDFNEAQIYGKDVTLKTYNGSTEDDIPTRRCILYGKEGGIVYKNYRHIGRNKIDDDNQYRDVQNMQGELSFIDYDGNCETTRDLYGSMKMTAKSDDDVVIIKYFGGMFIRAKVTPGLLITASNTDNENPITYYIFEAQQPKDGNSTETGYDNNRCWYPLNEFELPEETDKNTIDCKCDGNDPTKWVWDGSRENAAHFFNKNTTEKIFRDKSDEDDSLACERAESHIEVINDEGEKEKVRTNGYGTTGSFKELEYKPYFLVACTENGCRAVSPVFDYHSIYYIIGLVDKDDEHFLRVALVYVLKGKGYGPGIEDGYVKGGLGDYSKYPRNYYLTQFNFTVDYEFGDDSHSITNEDVLFEKLEGEITEGTMENGDTEAPIGTMKYQDNGDGTFTVFTKVVGRISESDPQLPPPPPTPEGGDSEDEGTTTYAEGDEGTNEGGADPQPSYPDIPLPFCYMVQDDKGIYYVQATYENGVRVELGTSSTPVGTLLDPNTTYQLITDATTGEFITIKYINVEKKNVDYDPSLPHFIRYNDKSLTEDEYKYLKDNFNEDVSAVKTFTITDVTGLKREGILHAIIKQQALWNKYLKVP